MLPLTRKKSIVNMRVYYTFFLFIFYTQFGDCLLTNTTLGQFLVRSDYNYDEQVGGWVKWHPVPAGWHEARLRCHYEGAVLASPVNKNLKKAMIKMLHVVPNLIDKLLFTGIHSTFSKGDYTTIDGVPLHKMSVEWGSYRGCNDHECTALDCDGFLEAYDCSHKLHYMCFKKAPRDLHTTICGTVDQEYKYYAETGSCYKFHNAGRTWTQAYMTCLAEGGHLAIINSYNEAKVIQEIFNKNPAETIRATYIASASIGFRLWGEPASWWTIHGQDLSEAGYAYLDTGLSDIKEQSCGSFRRTGEMANVWCDNVRMTLPAICEINPGNDV